MEIEVVKKLIKKYTPGHTEFVRKTEVADRYYRNKTDILFPDQHKKEEQDERPLRNADNRVPFNFHGLLVNQKASYMFTAPPLFDLGNKKSNRELQKFLGDKYPKVCKDLCIDASNTSIGWLHLWRDKQSKCYKYAVVHPEQIIPIWSKGLEKELEGVLRCYNDIREEDGKSITVYEYWNDKICETYMLEGGQDIEDGLQPYMNIWVTDVEGNADAKNIFEHGIGEVPFFPFFNNNIDTGDLDNIKELIDVYCKVFSGFANDLEDIQEIIFVLTNYGGVDLNEFLSDLKHYKAIKLDNDGGDDKSGVSTLTIELPVEAREKLMATARKCIFEQGQGIDPDPQNFGNSSGVALNFLYALLELKAGLQETEFRLGFGRFIRCVCRLLSIQIVDDTIIQTWTRTSVRNDQELASIAQQSKGIISDATIVGHHPWVEDAEKEAKQIAMEEQEAEKKEDYYSEAFQNKDSDVDAEE